MAKKSVTENSLKAKPQSKAKQSSALPMAKTPAESTVKLKAGNIPAVKKKIPDVSLDLSMIGEKLDFVLESIEDRDHGVKALSEAGCAGLVATLFGIKWEIADIQEKLYPSSSN